MVSDTVALERAYRHAVDYLDGLDTRPVATTKGLNDLRDALRFPLGAAGVPPGTVIDELVQAAASSRTWRAWRRRGTPSCETPDGMSKRTG